jgi:hypothetical protein
MDRGELLWVGLFFYSHYSRQFKLLIGGNLTVTTAATEKSDPEIPLSWLTDANGTQVTPSVEDQPIEEGRARENNAKRFVKKRAGLYVVLEPVKAPETYLKLPSYSDDDEDDDAAAKG